ncbi:hypothetical protein [Anditalea andensis]|uniref:Outer membrane protein beta-barrel domain-containing protein n=1 Tax=Anditalea andensis TaxID=1048983 RepID=A0A074KR59_9BACT|nr:hypothetical protein [Anditalea andensis]KEO72441.1 hypothetical protein EL17_17010 [Anditalea andensis]
MKSFILIIVLFSLNFLAAHAQEVATQSVYVELGGAGLPYSINYDFRFDRSKIDSWGLRAGAGGWAIKDGNYSSTNILTIPVQVTRLLGKKKHYFEVGGGATFVRYRHSYTPWGQSGSTLETTNNWNFILDMGETPTIIGTLNLGYRRIPTDGGFTFRTNLTPIFNHNGFWPLWVGISFGYAF